MIAILSLVGLWFLVGFVVGVRLVEGEL